MSHRFTLLAASLATVALFGCGEQSQTTMQMPTPKVDVVTITSKPLQLTTELPGRTNDYRQAEIRPQVTGILQQRLFKEGEIVEAGQVLYQIDPAPYQATLSSANANLAKAQATFRNADVIYKRYQGLLKSKAVSQQDYDDAEADLLEAKADVASAEAEVVSAKINLDYTKITAPIGGKIGRSSVTEGALLTANQSDVLATIRQLDPIYVDMTQSSTELLKLKRALATGKLQKEQEVKVALELDDGTEYTHEGTLQFSEVNVDTTTGMVTLRAVFPNEEGELLPGMFVRAKLFHAIDPDALLVPQRAVSRTPKGLATVLTVNDQNVVENKVVQVSRAVGDNWVVESGLKSGDKVIVAGLQKAASGATVQATDVTKQSAAAE